MNSDEGAINFAIRLSNAQLQADANSSQAILRGIGNAAVAEGNRMESAIGSALKMMGAAAGIASIGTLGQSIIAVRGEFQQLGIAFETMLGSKAKADKIMQEAIVFAQATPFTLTDVATNIKQLMAMGIATDKVMGTMKALGDVAAGVSVPISRVAINYGQVAALGKLQGREIHDFAMAGIPIVGELAKMLGKSANEIFNMSEAGSISFPMVEQAFKNMSSQGGQFYNLMEKQNASVTGQISNLSDKWQVMLNDIGKSNEGIIYGGIGGLSAIIANYKAIGETVAGLIAIYGVYKLAVITVNAVDNTRIAVIEAKKLALLADMALQDEATAATATAAAVEQAATDLMLANESARAAASAKTMSAKQVSATLTGELIALERAYAITVSQTNAAVMGGSMTATQQQIILQTELTTVETARVAAKKANAIAEKAITAETVLNTRITTEAVIASEASTALAREEGILVQRQALLASQSATVGDLAAARAKGIAATAQKLLNATMLNNPYVLFAAAVGAIAYGLYKWYNYQSDLTKALNKSNGEIDIEKDKASQLFASLKGAAEGTAEWKKAKDTIIGQYGSYLTSQQKELNTTILIAEAYGAVTKSIEENVAAKIKSESLQAVSANVNPKISDAVTSLSGSIKSSLGREVSSQFDADLKVKVEQIKYATVPAEKAKLIAEYDKIISDVREKVMAGGGIFKTVTLGDITSFSIKIKTFLSDYSTETEAINQAFGNKKAQIEQSGATPEKAVTTTWKKELEKYKLAKAEAEKVLKNLETNAVWDEKKEGKSLSTAIEEQRAIIKEANDKLGISNKKSTKEAIDREKEITEAMKTATGQRLAELAKELEAILKVKAAQESRINAVNAIAQNKPLEAKGADTAYQAIYGALGTDNTQENKYTPAKSVIDRLQKDGEEAIKKTERAQEEKGKRQRSTTKRDNKEIADEFYAAADAANLLSNAIGDGNRGLADMIGGIANLAGSMGDLAKKGAFTSGGAKMSTSDAITSGFSGASQILGVIIGQAAANKKAQEEWNAVIAEGVHQASLLKIETLAYKDSNVFGVENPYSKAIAGANQYGAAMGEMSQAAIKLEAGQVQTGTKKVANGANIVAAAAGGAVIGAAIGGGILSVPAAVIGGVVGGLIGLFAAKKSVPVFESLKKQYGEIYNKDTFELNPKILADYGKLDAATKQLVDNWKELKEAAKAAQDEMLANFKALAGDLGTSLADSIINAFRNGKLDAAIDEFHTKVGDVIADLIYQMLFAQFMQPFFDKAQEGFNNSFGVMTDANTGKLRQMTDAEKLTTDASGKLIADYTITDDLDTLGNNIVGGVAGLDSAMSEADQMLKDKGYANGLGGSKGAASRTASSKGFTAMSQDSADELNGRFTAMQGHTFSINEGVKILTANSAGILKHLAGIESNTGRLEAIENGIGAIKGGIDDINLKGITLRK